VVALLINRTSDFHFHHSSIFKVQDNKIQFYEIKLFCQVVGKKNLGGGTKPPLKRF
jgi:hypothetical protein